ncbi:MAG: hypothetical protein HGA98_02090, partial [Deltaproteobacteria bacterium]|nr:hypothetical protein [Deltaproteobacteria bacterium]
MEAPVLAPADRVRAVLTLLRSARGLLGEAAAPLERWEERLLHLGGEGDERLRAAVA